MNCPMCNVALNMTERQGVEIDYCPKCRGVWLDRGELDKLIERAAERQPAQQQSVAPPPTVIVQEQRRHDYPHYRGDDYSKYKKRKSLLGEIFDF
jgi:uncharacterized protein